MDTYSKIQSGVVLLSALLGVIVTFWPPDSFKIKLAIVFTFAVLGLTAIFLQQQKEKEDKVAADLVQAELLNWQRGDQKNPARIGHPLLSVDATGVATIQFIVENPSEFPTYDFSGRIWDTAKIPNKPQNLDEILSHDIATINIQSLSGNTVQIVARVVVPPTESVKTFAAQFTTRVGGFYQTIQAQNVGGKWLFASRVLKAGSEERVFQQIDPGFPLNAAGDIDWR